MTVATIIVPTHDHGLLLTRAVRSALGQTVQDLEVFIIGDGATEATRAAAAEVVGDPRVRYFDHSKSPRTGEPYRHAALAEARGEIVCYLADDDLYFPDHVETMHRLLQDADFAHTPPISVTPQGVLSAWTVDLQLPVYREKLMQAEISMSLSCCAHTLAFYRGLPYGWRTTPASSPTDRYMWQQMLALPSCRVASSRRPTLLIFPSPDRQGWTLAQRLAEIDLWVPRLTTASLVIEALTVLVGAQVRECAHLLEERDRLVRARDWLASEHTRWQEVAAHQAEVIAELRSMLNETIKDRDDLVEVRDWLAVEHSSWQETARNQEQVIADQRSMLSAITRDRDDLRAARDWLAAEHASWQQVARTQEQVIAELRTMLASAIGQSAGAGA
jgi:GalNAc5-diNAcBac-PP-undecaprenol beta-1,3-glucosyltransferase